MGDASYLKQAVRVPNSKSGHPVNSDCPMEECVAWTNQTVRTDIFPRGLWIKVKCQLRQHWDLRYNARVHLCWPKVLDKRSGRHISHLAVTLWITVNTVSAVHMRRYDSCRSHTHKKRAECILERHPFKADNLAPHGWRASTMRIQFCEWQGARLKGYVVTLRPLSFPTPHAPAQSDADWCHTDPVTTRPPIGGTLSISARSQHLTWKKHLSLVKIQGT